MLVADSQHSATPSHASDGLTRRAALALACGMPGAALRAASAPAFPLRISANRRHLEGQDGRPFLYHADTPWHLFNKLTRDEVRRYLDDRQRRGFTTLQVQLIVEKPYPNRDGHEPFARANDMATPNEAFFAHVDWALREARQRQFLMVVAPAWLGCCQGGWRDVLQANGPDKVRGFGRWLGERYRTMPNLLWLLGGDRNPGAYLPVVRALAEGLKETDRTHLLTAHAGSPHSAAAAYPDEAWLDVNTTYTYTPGLQGVGRPQYHVYAAALADYRREPVRPFVMLESAYENERGSTPQWLRRQAYWALLSGAAGHAMGNLPIYVFEKDWEAALDQPGSRSMAHLARLFADLPWHQLVPDADHQVLTGGYGTFSATTDGSVGHDYATAAVTSDGRTLVAYLPTPRPVTVDPTRLQGRAAGRWFDPSTGKWSPATGKAAAGPQLTLTPPPEHGDGHGDWVLVIEARR